MNASCTIRSSTRTWDLENRLSSVNLPANGGTVSFTYDPFGRRIQKTTASGSTIYVYDGANVVAEYNSAGAVATGKVEPVDTLRLPIRLAYAGFYIRPAFSLRGSSEAAEIIKLFFSGEQA